MGFISNLFVGKEIKDLQPLMFQISDSLTSFCEDCEKNDYVTTQGQIYANQFSEAFKRMKAEMANMSELKQRSIRVAPQGRDISLYNHMIEIENVVYEIEREFGQKIFYI